MTKTNNYEEIEKAVLERTTNKITPLRVTIEFIMSYGYTRKEAEEIFRKIVRRHSTPSDDLY